MPDGSRYDDGREARDGHSIPFEAPNQVLVTMKVLIWSATATVWNRRYGFVS